MHTNLHDYTAKSTSCIINELLSDKLNEISKLPEKAFDPELGVEVNKREISLQKLWDDNEDVINNAIKAENIRVTENLKNIPMNTVIDISLTTSIQRVPNGWIYITNIYNTSLSPIIINKSSVFVPEVL